VIRHHFKWKRSSMAAALCYGSRGGAQLAFHHQLDAYDTDTLIGALGARRRALGWAEGDAVVGRAACPPQPGDARLAGPSAVLARSEPLPAYAPELNPVEPLWANLKGVELANLAGEGLDEVIAARGVR
jgi:hypothetical protein